MAAQPDVPPETGRMGQAVGGRITSNINLSTLPRHTGGAFYSHNMLSNRSSRVKFSHEARFCALLFGSQYNYPFWQFGSTRGCRMT